MRIFLSLLFLGLLCAGPVWTRPARACPVFLKGDPRVGSEIQNAPPYLTLRFSGPMIVTDSEVKVLNAAGHTVSSGASYAGATASEVRLKLNPLVPGRYKVVWHIHCHCDGDTDTIIPGDYKFTVLP